MFVRRGILTGIIIDDDARRFPQQYPLGIIQFELPDSVPDNNYLPIVETRSIVVSTVKYVPCAQSARKGWRSRCGDMISNWLHVPIGDHITVFFRLTNALLLENTY